MKKSNRLFRKHEESYPNRYYVNKFRDPETASGLFRLSRQSGLSGLFRLFGLVRLFGLSGLSGLVRLFGLFRSLSTLRKHALKFPDCCVRHGCSPLSIFLLTNDFIYLLLLIENSQLGLPRKIH